MLQATATGVDIVCRRRFASFRREVKLTSAEVALEAVKDLSHQWGSLHLSSGLGMSQACCG